MTHIDLDSLRLARRQANVSGHVQRARMMFAAASLTALGIVAVAASIVTNLF